MHPSLLETRHRPWLLPDRPWAWRQTWRDLLFAHWPVPADRLRGLVPPSLSIQEFDGTAWLGAVPFLMTGVTRRPLPELPGMSRFGELNLRTYVEAAGRPGVWFLSLDAANPLAVWVARRYFHLPYFHARIDIQATSESVRYVSTRRQHPPGLSFVAEYGPTSGAYHAEPGSLEHWLVERYCLFAQAPDGSIYRTDIHHRPWSLQSARASVETNDLAVPHGIVLGAEPSLLHFSERIDVVVWSPEAVVPDG